VRERETLVANRNRPGCPVQTYRIVSYKTEEAGFGREDIRENVKR
jgi:hypothetical protein